MAHNNTIFAQLLKLVPRHEFETLAKKCTIKADSCGKQTINGVRLD